MHVQWLDNATQATRRMSRVRSIEEEGDGTICITGDDEQEHVPDDTDLFVWGKAN